MNQSRKALNYLGAQARRIMNSTTAKVSAAAGALTLATAEAQASVPAEITAMTDDADTVFDSVKTVKVSIVAFLILLGIVKIVKGR